MFKRYILGLLAAVAISACVTDDDSWVPPPVDENGEEVTGDPELIPVTPGDEDPDETACLTGDSKEDSGCE